MSTPGPSLESPGGRRSLRNLRKLPRSTALSKYRASMERVGKAPSKFPALSYFSPSAWWNWFRTYAGEAFQKSYPFPTGTGPHQSIYPLLNENGEAALRVTIAGDWGTGTDEAYFVTESMAPAHYTVHLGDVYYIGDDPSIDENCLGIPNPINGLTPVRWRSGTLGSFSLNGNHEMYATGKAYFTRFLPKLGLIQNRKATGQFVSYFCLENDYWRVIALDTGYYSRGLPFLSMLSGVVPFLLPSCKLHETQMQWLRDVVKLNDDRKRGIILLSHHQYYSAFEEKYAKPAKQLAELIDRPVLWFWGHEHRMAGYQLQGSEKIQAHGRCLGHGGMPIERKDPPKTGGLAFYDNRLYSDAFGWNGYATLDFDGPRLNAGYYDIGSIRGGGKNQLLIEEKWNVDSEGQLSVEIDQVCLEKDFYGPKNWGG